MDTFVYGSLFYFYFYYFLQFNISDSVGNAMGIIIIFVVFIPIYFYYLRIKLRFYGLFLDLYGQEGVLATEVFQEMKKLNQIRKSDMFKKH